MLADAPDHLAGAAREVVDDRPRADPQRVVADPQATDADPFAGRAECRGIFVLVDVTEHDVEHAIDVGELLQRVPYVKDAAVLQPRAAKVVMCLSYVGLVELGQVDLAALAHGPGE